MTDEKIKVENGMVVFDSFETLADSVKIIGETVWEPKRIAAKEFLIANPQYPSKLKELWYEIKNREWGIFGLSMNEHARIFADEAEKLLGEHDWIVGGNCFSGWDLADAAAEALGEKEFER